MSRAVFHIGLMKTGTTYVQAILAQNRTSLQREGWAYPGGRENQQHACYGICGSDIYWVADDNPYQRAGAALASQLRTREQDVILSAEALSSLTEAGIERFLGLVGTPDAVVLTVRGLEQLIPSAWQQSLKSGATQPLEEFLDGLQQDRQELTGLWRTYAFGDIARRWSSFCPVEVVVVPRGRRTGELWELFRSAAGLPPLEHVSVEPAEANVSLSQELADTLVFLNRTLTAQGYSKRQQSRMRNSLLQDGIQPLSQDRTGSRIVLPARWHSRVRDWNEQEIRTLRQHGDRLHGDLSDLQLTAPPEGASESLNYSQVAAAVLAELLHRGYAADRAATTTGRG